MSESETVQGDVIANFGLEIGIFSLCSIIFTFFIMQRIKGNFQNLDLFFATKKWPFLSTDWKLVTYGRLLRIITYVLIATPIVSLIIWGSIMISVESQYDLSVVPGIAVLLIGLAALFLSLGVQYIKWSNFKVKIRSLILISTGVMLYIAFQIYALLDDTTVSFLGLSAVFLSINAIIMIAIAFMSYSLNTGSLLDIFDMLKANKGNEQAIETKYNDLPLAEQLEQLMADPEYEVTEREILNHLTIVQDKKDFTNTVLAGGLQSVFRKKNQNLKKIVLLVMYGIAVAVLIIYAVLVHNHTKEESLGWVTTIAVITTDVIVYFISQLDLQHGPLTLTFIIIGMRCFLFGFGGDYWFLGYCSLYLLLTTIVGWKIISTNLPLEVMPNQQKIDQAKRQPWYIKLIKSPLFVYLITNIVFAIVVIVVATADLDIPKEVFTVYDHDYNPWVFGVASMLIAFTLFSIMQTFRLHQRRLKGIKDKIKFPGIQRWFSTYVVFVFFTYGFAILVGILWYALTDTAFILLTACMVPPMVICLYVLYVNYARNDYRILADIKTLNAKTQKLIDAEKANADKINKDAQGEQENVEVVQLPDQKKPATEDLVPEYLDFGNPKPRKLVIHEDWRQKQGFFAAFFGGKLLASDYANIFSILINLTLMLVYALVVYFTSTTYKLRGFTVAVTVFVYTCILLPLQGYFGTYAIPNITQIILYILGIVANYLYGALVIGHQYDEVEGDTGAVIMVIYFFFFIPISICVGAGYYNLRTKKTMSRLTLAFFGLALLHWIGLGVFFAIVDVTIGWAVVFGILAVALVGGSLYYVYLKRNRSLPRNFLYLAGIIVACIIILIFALSLALDSFNDYVGFAITYMVFLIVVAFFVIRRILNDFANQGKNPVFYSPWVFPIYRYDPQINNVKPYNSQGYASLGIIFAFWVWSITVTIWVRPVSVGITLGCLAEVIALVWCVFMTTYSTDAMSSALSRPDLFQKCVKRAWLQARNAYLQEKHVNKVADVVTYEEYLKEKETLLGFIKALQNKHSNSVGPTDTNLKAPQELRELFEKLNSTEKHLNEAFNDEVRFLIHFELLLITSINQIILEEKNRLVNFIHQYRPQLQQVGLSYFNFGPETKTLDARYKLVIDRYAMLSAEDKAKFDDLKEQYFEELRKKDEEAAAQMKKEEQAGQQRQKELADKINRQKNLLKKDLENLPIDEMPDCVEKYQKIIKEYTGGKKYEDAKFPANETVLGEQLRDYVTEWKRPEGLTVFGEGFNPIDPRQGAIGDCYFISAMTVAGKQHIEGVMMVNKLEQRPETGAFIVTFYFEGEPIEVIVDDRFPVDATGEYAFCKSETGTKLWPMIIEKAYAKLHGGYNKIIGGKVNYALSDLTDGYPEEIKLSVAQKNLDSLWETLMSYTKQGYLLGAGSPENPMGDAAISPEGIIQGHAYAILDVKEFEGERLLQLRNPHGNGGAEWNGDWSDGSYKWTEKARKVLNAEAKEDGVFWMSLEDFAYEFKSVYICRIFDPKIWKTCPQIEGEWKGETAAGLPTKKNPSADMSKNPHYTIKVNRRCTAFIALTQLDRVDMFRGNKPIMFMVQKNGGKRITSTAADLLVGTSGSPTDLLTVSAQISLDASSYPYTFTLMVASSNSGPEGEGRYQLNIYCTEDFTVNKL